VKDALQLHSPIELFQQKMANIRLFPGRLRRCGIRQ
jgi:hypothetical protein